MIRTGAIVALLCAEALAFYTFAELIAAGYTEGTTGAASAGAFLAIALVAYAVPRFVEGFEISPRAGRVGAAAAGLIALHLVLRLQFAGNVAFWDLRWLADLLRTPEETLREGAHVFVAAVLLFALWVRISLRAADDIDLESMTRYLAIPFAAATIIVIFGASTDRDSEVARAGIAFYGTGVLALACAQLALSGVTFGDLRAGGVVSTMLLATVALVVGSLVVLTLGLAYLGPVLGPPLGAALNLTLTIILTPIAWVLEKLFDALLGNRNPFENLDPSTFQVDKDAKPAGEGDRSALYVAWTYLVRGVVLVAVALLVAGVAWLITNLRQRVRQARGVVPESSTAGGLGEDARALLRSLFRRGERAPTVRGSGVVRLYAEVLQRAEKDARPRQTGETPSEFAPVLAETFHASVTDDITHAFEQARYAGREPDPRALHDLERRWHALS